MLPASPHAGRRSASATRPPPGSHSRSTSQPRAQYTQDDTSYARGRVDQRQAARQVRPQRSVGNLSSGRGRDYEAPPPMPPLPRQRQMAVSSQGTSSRPAPSASRASGSSDSSSSSSSSSFLDRMRQRYQDASSSQSSFEVEQEDVHDYKDRGRNDQYMKREIRDDVEKPSVSVGQEQAPNDYISYGYSIWNRITTAASDWTWSGTAGEGMASDSKDTELTRILKAYHISKARDRTDLPDWLFSEHERRPVRDDGPGQDRRRRAWEDSSEVPDIPRSRGFRDIYDSVDADNYGSNRSAHRSSPIPRSEVSTTTKATDRLKAIRDAKRQAATTIRTAEPSHGRQMERSGHYTESFDRHRRTASTDPSSGRGGARALEPPNRMQSPRTGGGLPRNPRGR